MARLPEKPRFAAAPSARVYDAIVLGPSLGGAFAAALLARRGLRVLWAEHGGPGASYVQQGFVFPTEAVPLPSLRALPPLEDALHELGLTTQVSRVLRPVVPALQLVLQRHRLDLPLDDARRLQECNREFGKAGARIASVVKQLQAAHTATDGFLRQPEALPPAGIMARWRVRRAVKAWPALQEASPLSQTEPAEHLLARALPFLVYQDDAGPLAVQRSLGQLLAGPQRYPSGLPGLHEVLRHRFQELGGTLLPLDTAPGAGVQALSVEGGRPVGLDVRGSEATHRAAFLLSALDDVELLPLLPEALHAKASALRAPSPTHAVLAVHWVLPVAALPQGLGELILVDDAEGLGAYLVQVGPVRRQDARAEEASLRLVTAAVVVPPETEKALVAGHALRLEEALERLLPFARSKVVARSVPQLDAPRRAPGFLLHPLWPRPAKAAWEGLGLVPPATPWSPLLRAGREVCPGLGLEGELLAALGAVSRVQRATQRGAKGR
jgi:phytoene dehydrogenase-like protein